MSEGSHRRRNLLTGDWILVSPHRLQRPWLGDESPAHPVASVRHDPTCALCAGTTRANGMRNPDYQGVYVFDNDFPALRVGDHPPADDLFNTEPADGICRVICYSPDHSLTMTNMSQAEVEAVVTCWIEQTRDLMERPTIQSVIPFENRGAMMGASNPHPHGQIWATSYAPNELLKEAVQQRAFLDAHETPLLTAYLAREEARGERLVCANASFAVVVPFWASWPFETLLIARRPVARLDDLSDAERNDLAAILRQITGLYDQVFSTPFPYSFGFHQAPKGGERGFVLHAHFYPPLLRSATIRKFMVGFEMLGEPQRDLTPEAAAARLRDLAR